jgi:hypothetical protein
MKSCVVFYENNDVVVAHWPDSEETKMTLLTSVIDGFVAKTSFADLEGIRCDMWADEDAAMRAVKPLNHCATALLSSYYLNFIPIYGTVVVVPESVGCFGYGFDTEYAEFFAKYMRMSLRQSQCRAMSEYN